MIRKRGEEIDLIHLKEKYKICQKKMNKNSCCFYTNHSSSFCDEHICKEDFFFCQTFQTEGYIYCINSTCYTCIHLHKITIEKMEEKTMKTFLRRGLLVAILFAIFQLSNTPNLHVSEPRTWFNAPQYEKHFSYKHFSFPTGTFYLPYRNIKNEEFVLHKISHIMFFSLLTTIIYLNLKEKRKRLFYSWLFATLFALTDEIHQSFIIGRSGRALDIGLDSLASLVAILLIWQVIKVEKVTTLVRSHL